MQNKPNFRSNKRNTTFLLTKYYEQITMNNEPIKTNPNKAKQTRSEFTPKGAEIPTGELLGILKPGTNQTQPVVSLSNLLQTSHPIFQNFPQNPLFPPIFRLFFSFFHLFFLSSVFCLLSSQFSLLPC